MTTSSHNKMGQHYTDQDMIETNVLDPNRPVDIQMFEKVEKENVEYYMNNGMDEKAARAKARENRRIAQ